jgi:hydrogenase-4 membrane subunit HyfE
MVLELWLFVVRLASMASVIGHQSRGNPDRLQQICLAAAHPLISEVGSFRVECKSTSKAR